MRTLLFEAMETLRGAEQALAMRVGYDTVTQLRKALMTDWGPIIGEQRAPGRKRSV